MNKMQKRLLKANEAAAYLSVSRSKVYEWLKQGIVPSIKVGRSRLFDVLDLDKFVETLK
jgi:excisionase family DNA binding protein